MTSSLGYCSVTSDVLEKELKVTEQALAYTEDVINKQQQQQTDEDDYDDDVDDVDVDDKPVQSSKNNVRIKSMSIPIELTKIRQGTESLMLHKDLIEIVDEAKQMVLSNNDNNTNIFDEAHLCHRLAQLFVQHDAILEVHNNNNNGSGTTSLYEDMYIPLYKYVMEHLTSMLRQELDTVRYPKNCKKLIDDYRHHYHHKRRKNSNKDDDSVTLFPKICETLLRCENSHKQTLQTTSSIGNNYHHHESITNNDGNMSIVLLELVRPIFERVKFHFVERSEDRVTSTRIDRLPEWLLLYLQNHVLQQPYGPYSLIKLFDVTTTNTPGNDRDDMSFMFLNELVSLVQWVLEERNFFRDPTIAGERSNPLLLYNAMEHFLNFDKILKESIPLGHHHSSQPFLGLFDTIVSSDEDLTQWWVQRERESLFSTLFEDKSSTDVPKPLPNHVSPRAEIFCSLIRSVQVKASLLNSPGTYLREVAVPLCSQFVDALHETSTDLRHLLTQKRLPPESEMISNLHEWIEIINGTHLAANVLLREGAWQNGMSSTSQSDYDLARFGNSLERLEKVLIDEFSAAFVETILMERAKFASYLMLASHLLASNEWDSEEEGLSVELRETNTVLQQLHRVCNSILSIKDEEGDDGGGNFFDQQMAHFAPYAIQRQVMDRVADKFLEVALDVHNMTPDIWYEGGNVFAYDVSIIMSSSLNLSQTRRLLDVTKLLSMETRSIRALFDALGGLVGASDFLNIHDFSADEVLYEEAMNMMKAKGLLSIELGDAVSVLNRRRD